MSSVRAGISETINRAPCVVLMLWIMCRRKLVFCSSICFCFLSIIIFAFQLRNRFLLESGKCLKRRIREPGPTRGSAKNNSQVMLARPASDPFKSHSDCIRRSRPPAPHFPPRNRNRFGGCQQRVDDHRIYFFAVFSSRTLQALTKPRVRSCTIVGSRPRVTAPGCLSTVTNTGVPSPLL